MNNLIPQDPSQADPSIVALMHGLKRQESGNDYNKTGDQGTARGSGQWSNQIGGKPQKLAAGQVPENFKVSAQQFGLNPDDFSPENQNKVMYASIAKDKQEGLSPEQILSKWNSGDANKYKSSQAAGTGPVGKYDVASYVKNAMGYAQEYAQKRQGTQGGFNPTPFSTGAINFSGNETAQPKPSTETSDTLGGELKQRGTDALSAINSIVGGEKTGNSRVSGLLQLGGAAGGAIGDVVNKGLELIPGVKGLENLVGKGVGAIAQTPIGQKVASAIQEFSQKHPELSKDIGAGFNIATAIPIVRGIGAIAGIAGDAASQALKGVAEKGVQSSLTEAGTSGGFKAAQFFQDGQVAKNMVDNRLIPDVEGGKYNSTDAFNVAKKNIGTAGEQVKTILSQPQYADVAADTQNIIRSAEEKMPNARLSPEKIIETARSLNPENDILWDKFEAGQANLQEINKLRSDLDRAVSSVYTTTNEPPIKKSIGASLAGAMRDYVKSTAKETVPLFDEMSSNYNAQRGLTFLHNKKVPIGRFEGLIKRIPVVGDTLETLGKDKIEGVKSGILKRTGKKAVRTPIRSAAKKAGIMAGVAAGKSALTQR